MEDAPGFPIEPFVDETGCVNLGRAVLGVQVALQEAYPSLTIEPSLQYRVASDYPAAMRELSQQLGHDLVPTTSNGAHGLAMTVDAVDHDIIVLDAALVKALFTSEMGMVVHSIHHELGHAHDHAVRRRGWAASLCQERFSPLRHRLFPLAERLWSEYHAERWSAGSIRGASLHAPILIEFVREQRHQSRGQQAFHGEGHSSQRGPAQ